MGARAANAPRERTSQARARQARRQHGRGVRASSDAPRRSFRTSARRGREAPRGAPEGSLMGAVLDAAARIRAAQGRPLPPSVRPAPPLLPARMPDTPRPPELHKVAAPIAPWRPPPPVLSAVAPAHVAPMVNQERARIRVEHDRHVGRAVEESNRIRNEHAQMISRANSESARIRAQHDALIARANRERARLNRQLAEAQGSASVPTPPTLDTPSDQPLMDLGLPGSSKRRWSSRSSRTIRRSSGSSRRCSSRSTRVRRVCSVRGRSEIDQAANTPGY